MMRVHPSRSAGAPRRIRGFSLIELMIAVSIIGVIASIALPSLQAYVWRARRNEAYINLKGIYTTQKTFQAENGRYGADFNELGFEISGATMIDPYTIQSTFYTYTVEGLTVDGVPNANYSAVATGDLDPSDAMLDIVMIEGGVIIQD